MSVRKHHAIASERINVRGLNLFRSITTDIAIAQVVRKDDDDVGGGRIIRQSRRRQQSHCESGQKSHSPLNSRLMRGFKCNGACLQTLIRHSFNAHRTRLQMESELFSTCNSFASQFRHQSTDCCRSDCAFGVRTTSNTKTARRMQVRCGRGNLYRILRLSALDQFLLPQSLHEWPSTLLWTDHPRTVNLLVGRDSVKNAAQNFPIRGAKNGFDFYRVVFSDTLMFMEFLLCSSIMARVAESTQANTACPR